MFQYIHWLKDQLDVQNIEDLFHITHGELVSLQAVQFVRKYGVLGFLAKCFPQYGDLIASKKKPFQLRKTQRKLYKYIRLILNGIDDVLLEFKHPLLEYSKTYRSMKFDIYAPNLSLAIEYQGLIAKLNACCLYI
jgi:hypothetical protein